MNYISNFTSDTQYIQGEQNVAADCLSRPTENQIKVIFEKQSPLNYEKLAEAQDLDPSISLLQQSDNSLQISTQKLPKSNRTILVDTSTGIARPLVPIAFCRKVFDLLHSLAHPGIKSSQKLISQRFVWPKIHIDVRDWIKAYVPCQRTKVHRHNVTPLQKCTTLDERFSHVHLDLVGPLPASEGPHTCLQQSVGLYHSESSLPNPVRTTSYFIGLPALAPPTLLLPIWGRQFTSTLWQELAELLGAKLTHTTSYHPASNGLVERMHRTPKTALKTQENPTNWFSNLGFVLLGLRAAVKEDLGFSTSEITIGKPLRVPGQLLSAEHDNTHSQSNYRQQLTQYLNSLKPTESRHPSSQKPTWRKPWKAVPTFSYRTPPTNLLLLLLITALFVYYVNTPSISQ